MKESLMRGPRFYYNQRIWLCFHHLRCFALALSMFKWLVSITTTKSNQLARFSK